MGPDVLTQGFMGTLGSPEEGPGWEGTVLGNLVRDVALHVLEKWLWTLWQAARPGRPVPVGH